jgi:hypothetical protein
VLASNQLTTADPPATAVSTNLSFNDLPEVPHKSFSTTTAPVAPKEPVALVV